MVSKLCPWATGFSHAPAQGCGDGHKDSLSRLLRSNDRRGHSHFRFVHLVPGETPPLAGCWAQAGTIARRHQTLRVLSPRWHRVQALVGHSRLYQGSCCGGGHMGTPLSRVALSSLLQRLSLGLNPLVNKTSCGQPWRWRPSWRNRVVITVEVLQAGKEHLPLGR